MNYEHFMIKLANLYVRSLVNSGVENSMYGSLLCPRYIEEIAIRSSTNY